MTNDSDQTTTRQRQRASLDAAVAVSPVAGADAIEAVTVRGWNVVVRLSPGDPVPCVEIDAALRPTANGSHSWRRAARRTGGF